MANEDIRKMNRLLVIRALKGSAVDLHGLDERLRRCADDWSRVYEKLHKASNALNGRVGRIADMAMESNVNEEQIRHYSARALRMQQHCSNIAEYIEQNW